MSKIRTVWKTGALLAVLAVFAALVVPALKPAREHSRTVITDPVVLKHIADAEQALNDARRAWQDNHNAAPAERLYGQLLQKNPNDMFIWHLLAKMRDEQGMDREALVAYERLMHPPPHNVSNEASEPKSLYRYATLLDKFGRQEEALQIYHRVLGASAQQDRLSGGASMPKVSLSAKDATELRARAAMLAGFDYNMGMERPQRLACFREAVRLLPELPITHYYLGYELQLQNRKQESKTEYARAEKLGDVDFRKAMHWQAYSLQDVIHKADAHYDRHDAQDYYVDEAGELRHRVLPAHSVTPAGSSVLHSQNTSDTRPN